MFGILGLQSNKVVTFMETLNNHQIMRQDFVDNAIYELLCTVNPTQREIKWDIEAIGEIRDLIRIWLTKDLKITDEMTFYPYINSNS
jgi:hypothetical protein